MKFKNETMRDYVVSLALSAILVGFGYAVVYGASAGGTTPQSIDTTLLIGNTTTKSITVGNASITGTATASKIVTTTNATFNATSTATGIEVIHGLGNGDVINSETSGTGRLYWGNHTGASGNLMELLLNSVSQFAVDHTGNVTATGSITGRTLVSTVGSGTAPLTVTSTTKVNNLNADQLDGYSESDFVQITGDTMTGALTVGASAADALTANGTSTYRGAVVTHGLGAGNAVQITNSGTGYDIAGTSDSWHVSKTGTMTAVDFYGDGSHLTGISSATPTLQVVTTAGATTNQNLTFTGSLTTGTNALSGSQDVKFWGSNGAATPTYFLWDASKSAVRAGYCHSTNCDDTNVGMYSVGMGYGHSASGLESIAIGSCSSSQAHAICLGYVGVSQGNYSTMIGYSDATKDYSTAIGYNNQATGNYSVVLGNNDSKATGASSVVIGEYVTASNTGSHAIGRGASSSDRLTNSTANSLAIGFNSTLPTVLVGAASGAGTYGQTDINGVLSVAGGYASTGATIGADGDITTSGQVGIGTNSLDSFGLKMLGNSYTDGAMYITSTADYESWPMLWFVNSSATSTQQVAYFQGAGDQTIIEVTQDSSTSTNPTINVVRSGTNKVASFQGSADVVDIYGNGNIDTTGKVESDDGFTVNGSTAVNATCIIVGATAADSICVNGSIIVKYSAGSTTCGGSCP